MTHSTKKLVLVLQFKRWINRVPAMARGKGGIHTSARWQVILYDPIWHASFP